VISKFSLTYKKPPHVAMSNIKLPIIAVASPKVKLRPACINASTNE
jgi:hypothetical protein